VNPIINAWGSTTNWQHLRKRIQDRAAPLLGSGLKFPSAQYIQSISIHMNDNFAWPKEIYQALKKARVNQAFSTDFAIDLAHKDLSLIMDAANRARLPLPVGAAAREMYSVAPAAAPKG
jgi:NAD-binding of NADP-dependent 3-hydroxyisobutyrate dehydrogenase